MSITAKLGAMAAMRFDASSNTASVSRIKRWLIRPAASSRTGAEMAAMMPGVVTMSPAVPGVTPRSRAICGNSPTGMYSVATKANEPTATDKTASHDGPRDVGSRAGMDAMDDALSSASDALPEGQISCWAFIDVLRFG